MLMAWEACGASRAVLTGWYFCTRLCNEEPTKNTEKGLGKKGLRKEEHHRETEAEGRSL